MALLTLTKAKQKSFNFKNLNLSTQEDRPIVDDLEDTVLETRMRVYAEDTHKLLGHYPSNLISCFKADQRPLEVPPRCPEQAFPSLKPQRRSLHMNLSQSSRLTSVSSSLDGDGMHVTFLLMPATYTFKSSV
jgi:hypothetical protein